MKQISLSAEVYAQLEQAAAAKELSVEALASGILSEGLKALGVTAAPATQEDNGQYAAHDDEAIRKRLHDLGYLD